MREPGYYWVKADKHSQWEPIVWDGESWEGMIIQNQFVDYPLDGDLYEIAKDKNGNETRILNPDEVQSIAQSTE